MIDAVSTTDQTEKEKLYSLLQLEEMARHAESLKELFFIIANETRRLVNYRQAFLFVQSHTSASKYTVNTVSSIAVIDSNEPYITWLNKVLANIQETKSIDNIIKLDYASCPEKYKNEWNDYSMPFVLWVPLKLHDGDLLGGLWLVRETPWSESEILLLKRISDTYAHAIGALQCKKRPLFKSHSRKNITLIVLATLLIISFIPIRLSTIAPVEIVAKNPYIVSSPIDGVVREIIVDPNTYVSKGQVLLEFEDTNFRNTVAIANKTLSVTQAELRKATQAAFQDNKSKAEIAVLKSQLELRQSELDYAKELLAHTTVKAAVDGLAIYTDKNKWKGRPVTVGEQIMQIANPREIKLNIELAVKDAILIEDNANVEVFLDRSPLSSLPATITHTSYEARVTPSDVLAYKLDAEFNEGVEELRIGLQGSAKIYGERVSLFFYVFRRPISSLRQFIGI